MTSTNYLLHYCVFFFSYNISLFPSGKNKDFKKQKGKRSCDIIEIIIYNGVAH